MEGTEIRRSHPLRGPPPGEPRHPRHPHQPRLHPHRTSGPRRRRRGTSRSTQRRTTTRHARNRGSRSNRLRPPPAGHRRRQRNRHTTHHPNLNPYRPQPAPPPANTTDSRAAGTADRVRLQFPGGAVCRPRGQARGNDPEQGTAGAPAERGRTRAVGPSRKALACTTQPHREIGATAKLTTSPPNGKYCLHVSVASVLDRRQRRLGLVMESRGARSAAPRCRRALTVLGRTAMAFLAIKATMSSKRKSKTSRSHEDGTCGRRPRLQSNISASDRFSDSSTLPRLR